MVLTREICDYINKQLAVESIKDFPNACNGLQVQNNGEVTHLGGAVDAGPISLQKAIQRKVDFLCVHHGLFWNGAQPLVDAYGQFYNDCFRHNIAIYSVHLPLDVHPTLGHNASLLRLLNLKPEGSFACFEGIAVGLVASTHQSRTHLKKDLQALFPSSLHCLEFGPERPKRIGIVSGSGGQHLLTEVLNASIDTLITGEVRYASFTFAQFYGLNIFACGHYATETFGIKNLLLDVSRQFNLPYEFLDVPSDL